MLKRYAKHSEEFRKWQQKFYNSKRWKELRNEVRAEKKMRCDKCTKLIRGKSIVDHIKEIDEQNKEDESITLSKDNLQLLCLSCHNTKTHYKSIEFTPNDSRQVNLF